MKENKSARDVNAEGKDKLYLDIDRMINEGLSAGTVYERQDSINIDETINLEQEIPLNDILEN